jgi:flagellar hook-basal body complex protein FliE
VSVLPVGAVGAALSSATAGLGGASSTRAAAERGLGGSALGGSAAAGAASRLGLGSPSGASGAFAGSALEGAQAGGSLRGAGGIEAAGGSSGNEGIAGVEGATGSEGAGGAGAEGAGGGGFGEALTHAISSLEGTQLSSDGAAQALATGTAGNPESAVVTVEDAQLAMQLASQVRTKAVEAVQQIFQTQV